MTITRTNTVIKDRPVIELHNVSRSFELQRDKHRSFQESFIRLFRRRQQHSEKFWPLRNISLSIYPGDCMGIIGVNGSGKSTLLKLVSGILPPTGGDLTVHGRVSSLLELGAGFHPELTGRENIYLNGSIYGMTRKEMDKRLEEIVDYAELGEFIDTPIKHYSSGMYVRLGFAVAIHTDPDIMLVDEVLAVGDMSFQRKCMRSINEFRRRGGTLMLVSHDLTTMQTICDRLLWIEDGVIRAEGNSTDVAMAYQEFNFQREEESRRLDASRHEYENTEDDGDGNARQNTSRSEDETLETAERHRWGTGRIQITRVVLSDHLGNEQALFHSGGSMVIQLHYEALEKTEHPIFGLAIYTQQGTHLSGPNTKFGGLDIPFVLGSGIICYSVTSLSLLPGDYLLSVAAVNQDDTETFDFHDRTIQFSVAPGVLREQYGLLTLGGSWGCTRVQESIQSVHQKFPLTK